MPELPEVETLRRSLLPHLQGRLMESVQVFEHRLRRPLHPERFCAALRGRRVLNLRRRAKYLLFDLDDEQVLLAHLGMSGSMALLYPAIERRKHDHVVWALEGGIELRFHDPRRFGVLDVFARELEAQHPSLQPLGIEPLSEALHESAFFQKLCKRKQAIKQALMDAHLVVGIGNIYASEALFRAGIHPSSSASSLTPRRYRKLAESIQHTLQQAIECGGTTLRDFHDAEGQQGYFALELQVYGREGEPCPRCARPVERFVQVGRSTFFCARCQR